MIIKSARLLGTALALSIAILSTSSFSKPFLALQNGSVAIVSQDTTPPNAAETGEKVFELVDEEAYFPGKDAGWLSFLEQNLRPSTPVDNGAPAGSYTVYIQFIVDLDGKLSGIKALTKHGYGMEAEVMRILRKSPPWIPAVQAGKPVRADRKQPVTFQIIEEKKKKRKKD